MWNRALRRLLFVAALACLVKSVSGYATRWSVGGFFLFGALWYWLGWRQMHALDSPKPR